MIGIAGLAPYLGSGFSSPASLSLTGWWRANYTGSPWNPTASIGSSSAASNLSEATNPPTAGTALNGLTTAKFNGGTSVLNTSTTMASFWTTAGSLWVLFYADGISAASGSSLSIPALFADTGSYFLMTIDAAGVHADIFSGGRKSVTATGSFGDGFWHLAQLKWDSSNLYLRVDRGSWSSVAAGAPDVLTGAFRAGEDYSSAFFFNGLIAEIGISDRAFSDTTFNGIASYVETRYNISLTAFVPKSRSNCLVWHDTDSGFVGGAGASWSDQGPSGDANRALVQASGSNGPTKVTADPDFNGIDSVKSDGSAQAFASTGDWSGAPIAQPTTHWFVGRIEATPNSGEYYFDGPASGLTRQAFFESTGSQAYAGSQFGSPAFPVRKGSIVAVVYNGASSAIYIDNMTTAAATGDASTGGISGETLFRRYAIIADEYVAMKMVAKGAFQGADDLATRTKMSSFLKAKYLRGARTFYLKDAAASGSSHGSLQDGGTGPTAASTTTEWTSGLGGIIPTKYSIQKYANAQNSATFGASTLPDGTNPGTDDCWRTENTISGTFASGTWTVAIGVFNTNTIGASVDGNLNIRVWRSTNATGTSATQITSAAVSLSTFTNLTTTQQNTTATFNPGLITLTGEYIFLQVAFALTGSASNLDHVIIRVDGTNSKITTPAFTPA